jgi:hypothetical protein
LKVGKKKLVAAGGLAALAGLALVAWLLWETDGLLAATFATLLIATVSLGWIVVQSQRQVNVLLHQTQSPVIHGVSQPDQSGEQAEQLLRAVHAGFARSDHILDRMIAEWDMVREELLSIVVRATENELGPIRTNSPPDEVLDSEPEGELPPPGRHNTTDAT